MFSRRSALLARMNVCAARSTCAARLVERRWMSLAATLVKAGKADEIRRRCAWVCECAPPSTDPLVRFHCCIHRVMAGHSLTRALFLFYFSLAASSVLLLIVLPSRLLVTRQLLRLGTHFLTCDRIYSSLLCSNLICLRHCRLFCSYPLVFSNSEFWVRFLLTGTIHFTCKFSHLFAYKPCACWKEDENIFTRLPSLLL